MGQGANGHGLALSAPGHLVLDPFCGSGSTLVAAKELYRDFIGIELDPKFHKMASGRVAAHTEMLPFFGEDRSVDISRMEPGKPRGLL